MAVEAVQLFAFFAFVPLALPSHLPKWGEERFPVRFRLGKIRVVWVGMSVDVHTEGEVSFLADPGDELKTFLR
jgi:hypothetical protein